MPNPENGAPAEVHLKRRSYDPLAIAEKTAGQRLARGAASEGRQRLLAQFTRLLTPEEVDLMASRGARVLGFVPDQAYVISVPTGFAWDEFPLRNQSLIAPTDKWSPLLDQSFELSDNGREPDPVFYLMLFHEDVRAEDARNLALNAGLEVREHPNLMPGHILVQGPEAVIRGLTGHDEVAYILPASEDLAKGWPVVACENGMVGGFPLSPLAASAVTPGAATGAGWGNIRTAVTVTTTWGALSPKLDPVATRAEIERALAEWSRVVQVSFRPGASATATRNLNILFATRSHGDSFPFTGASGVIAHAFFPAPPNPEPIAGDIHFNDDMPLRIGADTDLFSVALHEIGHALGLPHMDSGTAVMYPYYRRYTALAVADIVAIRNLYLSTEAGTGPTALFRLTANPVPNTVANAAAEVTDISGAVENGTTPIRVQWANNRGGSGTVLVDAARRWSIRNVPLMTGTNQITLTATDAANGRAIETVSLTRAATLTPATPTPGTPSAPSTQPVLRVSGPANNDRTSGVTARVTGTASAPQGLRRILWSTTAASGQAEGLGAWTIPALPLVPGPNAITVRAEATDGVSSTATLTLWRDTASDNVAPILTVLSPLLTSVATSSASMAVSGAAYDAGGVAEVTWQNSAAGSGTAVGTVTWRADVPLVPGFNTLTIRARDTAGNVAWRSLTITRR